MDAFYASVEQLDCPALRGKPILVGYPGPRSVVSTASYEARPFGVGSAMPMVQAMRLCPQAVVVPPRFARYQEISEQIMDVFRSFSPLVESLSLDEAFVDISGCERLHGSPRTIGENIRRKVHEVTGGLTISVGIASTKYVAKVASELCKPNGLKIVEDHDFVAVVHPLPVNRLWGIGKKSEPLLTRLGLRTIGDVARSDPQYLARHLGSLGVHIHQLANGIDVREVICERDAKSIGHEETLADNVMGAEIVARLLLPMADIVARRLREQKLCAGGVRVKLKTADFRLWTRQMTLREPTDNADVLVEAARTLLPLFDWDVSFRLVGMAAFNMMPVKTSVIQPDLFSFQKQVTRRRLDGVLDQAAQRFGEHAIRRGSDLDGNEM